MTQEQLIDYALTMGHSVKVVYPDAAVVIIPREQKAEKKPEPKKAEPKKEKKEPVDHGRIVALYKAGRSMEWIADDVGCSAQTVANHLKKEGLRA